MLYIFRYLSFKNDVGIEWGSTLSMNELSQEKNGMILSSD